MSETKAKSLNSPSEKMRQNKTESKTDPSVKAFFFIRATVRPQSYKNSHNVRYVSWTVTVQDGKTKAWDTVMSSLRCDRKSGSSIHSNRGRNKAHAFVYQ